MSGSVGAFERIQGMIAEQRCVVLDGGVSTELERVGSSQNHPVSDTELWGTWALYRAPHAALEVHRRYIAAGCDLISTTTWGILGAHKLALEPGSGQGGLRHWLDVARLGVRLAREAVNEDGGTRAVAFSLNGDIRSEQDLDRLRLLARAFEKDPPDLVLMETMSLIREGLTYPAVQIMLETGLPVWLSFRRCRHGVCGVFGQHWGGPEGDLFGRAAHRFQQLGVGALLINCLPASHVPGMLSWLRDFTDLPLGVYPNLGRYLDPGWKFDETIGPEDYARMARQWREEGAQIIGGCCGVTPEHMAAARTGLEGTRPGQRRGEISELSSAVLNGSGGDPAPALVKAWVDGRGRPLYPLAFPEIVTDPRVFPPTQGSFLVWKYLFQSGTGRELRCLDVGCGTGILAIQLALNGARQVDAVDIQREAVANTLANAVRNEVSDRVRGRVVDLYTYVPEQRYDLIIASLYQMPVDPMGEATGHRPVDFWGRNMLDHLISLLPDLLEEDGVAYLMQISVLSQLRTAELLEAAGFDCRVVDFSFFHFSELFFRNLEQIRRVEELSDAYHLSFGRDQVMVMYLLEVKRRREQPSS